MAECAVLASGSGSNFEAVVRALSRGKHKVCCLVSDNDQAYAIVRAQYLGIPWHAVKYGKDKKDSAVDTDPRKQAEERILEILRPYNPKLIVLAGFMRLLTPFFIDHYPGRIINIHPSLLPKYPGTRGIEESFSSKDRELGITIHLVEYGTDTGPILTQKSFARESGDTLREIEERIHGLEHLYYPSVIMSLLDSDGV